MFKAISLTNLIWQPGRTIIFGAFGLIGSAAMIAAVAQAAPDQRQGAAPRSAPTQMVSAASEAPRGVPFATGERLAKLDQLQAELAQLRIEADIAKAKADIRSALAGPSAAPSGPAALMPPLPMVSGPGLLPPLPAGGLGDATLRPTKSVPIKPSKPTYSMVEAWGSGAARQAVVRGEEGGNRIVRVGDHLGNEVVASIADGVVTLRGSRGQIRIIN